MSVLVTGAAGRVGANVVRRLRRSGADVRAMVMPGDPQAVKLQGLPDVQVVEADLRDQSSINDACRGVKHVIHLAAQLVRGDTPVDRFYDINALGTLRLLEAVVHQAETIERFVLISTDGTYRPGDPPAVPLDEHVLQHPADYYGTSKLLGEVILRNHAAQFDVPFSIVRFATVVSPEEAPGLFQLAAMRELLNRSKLGRDSNIWQLFRGHPDIVSVFERAVGDAADDAAVACVGPDGEPWSLHMVDVRDAAQGVCLALTEPGAVGRAFNIAAAEPTTTTEGAAVVADAMGVPLLTVNMPMNWRLEMTIDAAREHLGYAPKHDFPSMVETARAGAGAADDEFVPARA